MCPWNFYEHSLLYFTNLNLLYFEFFYTPWLYLFFSNISFFSLGKHQHPITATATHTIGHRQTEPKWPNEYWSNVKPGNELTRSGSPKGRKRSKLGFPLITKPYLCRGVGPFCQEFLNQTMGYYHICHGGYHIYPEDIYINGLMKR
jgi:hypothetical protein